MEDYAYPDYDYEEGVEYVDYYEEVRDVLYKEIMITNEIMIIGTLHQITRVCLQLYSPAGVFVISHSLSLSTAG